MSPIAHLVLHQPNLPPAALSFSPQTITDLGGSKRR